MSHLPFKLDNTKENVGDEGKRRSQRIACRKKLQGSFPKPAEVVNVNKPKPLTDNNNKSKNTIVIEKEETNPNDKRAIRLTNRNMNLPAQKHNAKKKTYDKNDSIVNGDSGNIGISIESISIVNNNVPDTEEKVNLNRSECSAKVEENRNIENVINDESISNEYLNQRGGKVLTPPNVFKIREGIRTPMSASCVLTPKRTSLTPNPRNFLRKIEDPIAQRIDSPKYVADLKQSYSNVPKSAIYFHQLVEKEETKFKLSSDRWNQILKEDSPPEEFHGNILAAIGQSLLFQNKRFKQFKELIELHKDKSAEKAAHVSDLDGFWDMIHIQVEDVHKRFAELELLKSNNWEEKKVEPVLKTKHVKKPSLLKVNTKEPLKIKKPAVPSKFKMFRQQMMAKKQIKEQTNDTFI